MARAEALEMEQGGSGAQVGSVDSLFELGLMYSNGRGVGVDVIEAHKWFNLAALKGSREAREYRAELSRDMSRAQIADAQRRAREWLQKTH
jgi:hypothetical protein